MDFIKRLYGSLIDAHFKDNHQMVFISGPRQVGKTTTCRQLTDYYLNWDNSDDRELILAGPQALSRFMELDNLREEKPAVLFDELHKFPGWKSLLKGFFDTYADLIRVAVTGSSRMDVYRRGGDSLMGRYFLYRMHPFSVREILNAGVPSDQNVIFPPEAIDKKDFDALWEFGGYPEPFVKRDRRFSNRWQRLRLEQLISEDIRNMTQIQQIAQLEVFANILVNRSSSQIVYSNLAKNVRISVDTARRWIDVLCRMHLGFLVRPWYKNVSRSLRKEPKWFLRDWAQISDTGARAETFIACHLLKAVEGWTDLGLGDFQLGYLRDKDQREVDFIVIRDGKPWFLAEVKYSDSSISDSLRYFQKATDAPYAFQVIIDADFVKADCFKSPRDPVKVPARTLLSQLL